MKLAASQIAWPPEREEETLALMRKLGFAGLEIAPPRVAGQAPYDHAGKAEAYAAHVREEYGLAICSMQSIWFGQQGNMFGAEREQLLEYTKKAVLFAKAAGCTNMVFGCPKNRVLPDGESPAAAIPFFKELGDFAAAQGTTLSLEANPALYGTNFINRTPGAFAMAKQVASPGFKVNLDFGTIVANGEDLAPVKEKLELVNHVHISEPNLALVQHRQQHRQLAALLRDAGYEGYVSLEMKQHEAGEVDGALAYIAEVFS